MFKINDRYNRYTKNDMELRRCIRKTLIKNYFWQDLLWVILILVGILSIPGVLPIVFTILGYIFGK